VGRLSVYRYRDVTKRLKTFGFAFDRQAAGSHEIWYQRSGNRYTTIPNHPGDMPEGSSTGGWLVLQTVARKRVRCGW
jgi:predicted RNA binding protein YcfA (HicA-like mRNA interferase family)